jgi:hypothetical protein
MTVDRSTSRTSPLVVAAAGLLGVALGLLPFGDGLSHAPAVGGLIGVLVALVLAIGIALAFLRLRGWQRWACIGATGLFVVVYWMIAGYVVLVGRSRQVDLYPRCGPHPTVATTTDGRLLGLLKDPADHGPHLSDDSGRVACVNANEAREEHRRSAPGGDLADGFHQVLFRFPGDETGLILLPMIALVLTTVSGILLAKSLPRNEAG